MIIDAWNQLDNIYLGRQSRPKLRHQVVMFQADVDSWWNLSLGHAIPAFVPWHELLAGGWVRLYAWTSTALCFCSLKQSRNYILHFWKRFFFFNVYLNKSYTNLTQAWELIDQRPLNAAENRWGHTAVGRGTLFGLGHCWMLQATTPLAANFFLKGMSRIGEFSWHKMEDFVGHVWWLDVIGG